MSYVYFFNSGERVKIGTSIDPVGRYKAIRTMNAAERTGIAGIMIGGRELEREMHKRFARYRLHGEWFEYSPEIRGFLELRCKRLLIAVTFLGRSIKSSKGEQVSLTPLTEAFAAEWRERISFLGSNAQIVADLADAIRLYKIETRVDGAAVYACNVRLCA